MTAKKYKLIFMWLAVLFCMLIIFLLSDQPAATSNKASKDIVKVWVDISIRVAKAEINEPEKWKIINNINSIAREYMHAVVYLILGLLVYGAVIQSSAKGIRTVGISLAICIAYSITDEIHQLFVPGRAFQLSDLGMDTLGSMVGIGLRCGVGRVFHKE